MVRILVENVFVTGKKYIEAAGLDTDQKPTAGIVTGSLFLEVNTGDVYAYDETSTGTWCKIAELGGGSEASVASTLSTSVLSVNRPVVFNPQVIETPIEEPDEEPAEEPVKGEEE